MANIPNKRPRRIKNDIEDQLEDLELYTEFKAKIIPELRKMLLSGAKDKDILAMYTPQVAARLVTIALTDTDNTKALAAIKDLLDRANGKATEHKKIDHQFSNLTDEQLDALIATERMDAEADDSKH